MRISLLWVGSACLALAAPSGKDVVEAARAQVGVTTSYDPSYKSLKYPGGDVPMKTGVCTDVVVRTFRKFGHDLQKRVHEDMKSNFKKYPQNWGLKRPDKNIDHRRVPNLMCYFKRQGFQLKVTDVAKNYQAGDLVVWDLGGGVLHIGVVSDTETVDGIPMIIHNVGSGAKEESLLFDYKIIGHYRYQFEKDDK